MIHSNERTTSQTSADGTRYLVDRLWPRGVKKVDLALADWVKEVAPSAELRHWFQHDPAKWPEFQRRYTARLQAQPETWQPLLQAARNSDITLVFGARDTEHNDAVVLKAFLEQQLQRHQ